MTLHPPKLITSLYYRKHCAPLKTPTKLTLSDSRKKFLGGLCSPRNTFLCEK